MFHYIKGTYEESGKDFVVIDCNGIGYKIFVPGSTIGRIGTYGQILKLYTYFYVREDTMTLYGFLSREELDMFELVISVSGVGPKAGLAVLSTLSPNKIRMAIIGEDIKALTSVPGIGSKTAHRIILELKDKIDKDQIMGSDTMDTVELHDDASKDAVDALVALGYSAVEASSAIEKIGLRGKNVEKLVKEALKILMK